MTHNYPDLFRATDWSCRVGNLLQPIRNSTQIWVVTRQYGISALLTQTSFRWETGGGVAKCRLFSQANFLSTFSISSLSGYLCGSNVYYHFCRKVHVLDLVLVLDQEAAPDPKDGRDPSRVLLHNHATTVLNHDHVLDHDPDRHDANRIPSRAQGPGRDPVHDLRANPSPDHVHVHALDLDHPEMIKKHLRNRKLMIIRIIIQQKEIGPVKLMMLSDKMSFS